MPRTIIEKLWDSHVVARAARRARAAVTSTCTWCMKSLRRRPFRACASAASKCAVPISPSPPPTTAFPPPTARCPSWTRSRPSSSRNSKPTAREFGIRCLGVHSDRQGIVHVIGPELGLTQPGMTVVCGDSHTATHGAFGALAFGIGTSEVEHVLATQCLLQRKSKTFQVRVDGTPRPRRLGQGHHPGADRADRHRRRHRHASSNTPAAPSARWAWKSA